MALHGCGRGSGRECRKTELEKLTGGEAVRVDGIREWSFGSQGAGEADIDSKGE